MRVETTLIDAAASHELLDNPQNPDRSFQYPVFRRSSERSSVQSRGRHGNCEIDYFLRTWIGWLTMGTFLLLQPGGS